MAEAPRQGEWPHGFYRASRDLPADHLYGPHRRIVVTAGIRHHPVTGRTYFSVTAEIVNKAVHRSEATEAVGPMPARIAEFFPELGPLLRLHLSDVDGSPEAIEARELLNALQF
jgi:hypothetical protein